MIGWMNSPPYSPGLLWPTQCTCLQTAMAVLIVLGVVMDYLYQQPTPLPPAFCHLCSKSPVVCCRGRTTAGECDYWWCRCGCVCGRFTVFSAGDRLWYLTQNCFHVALVQFVWLFVYFKNEVGKSMNCVRWMLTLDKGCLCLWSCEQSQPYIVIVWTEPALLPHSRFTSLGVTLTCLVDYLHLLRYGLTLT